MVFMVASMMMMMAILPTTHQMGQTKIMRMAMRFWAMARMARHLQCLHLGKMFRILIVDRWRTCQISCMKLKQITYMMHLFFLPPPSPRFFRASHAKNIDNPTTWIPVFLQKTNNTTWEVFDEDFSEIGPKLDWNGEEGLKNLLQRYYRCPNVEFIQRIQAACMQQEPPNLKVMHCGVLAGPLDTKFTGCLEKSPNTNNKQDSIAAATTSATSTIRLASRNPASSNTDVSGTCNNDLQTFLSMYGADLQAALDKHWDDVLRLLQMGTMAGQNMIPKKMLTKVRKANMTTMTQVNTLTAHGGSKEVSTRRLKELGSNAEHAAMELYKAKVAEQNAMEHKPPADIDAPVTSDVMIAGQESTVTDLQRANNFWQSHLPDRCHILSMEPDGNCFFRCISDGLNHDNGAGHDVTHHQLTICISIVAQCRH
jgi:hypothetical protein